jgi:hypothetical protein
MKDKLIEKLKDETLQLIEDFIDIYSGQLLKSKTIRLNLCERIVDLMPKQELSEQKPEITEKIISLKLDSMNFETSKEREDAYDVIKWALSFKSQQFQKPEINLRDERLKCDICGRHPNVIIITQFGTYCQEHARYV